MSGNRELLPALISDCETSGFATGKLLALATLIDDRPDSRDAVAALREAASPDARLAAARQLAATSFGCACSGDEPPEPGVREEEEAVELLGRRALASARRLLAVNRP